ncbi:T9SS type A sorting domain-containing protein [candidate division WOR-3 bacterium]|nr:T9SS type A sorting domain-containing protein [candidate division WOR-3 bacterium]
MKKFKVLSILGVLAAGFLFLASQSSSPDNQSPKKVVQLMRMMSKRAASVERADKIEWTTARVVPTKGEPVGIGLAPVHKKPRKAYELGKPVPYSPRYGRPHKFIEETIPMEEYWGEPALPEGPKVTTTWEGDQSSKSWSIAANWDNGVPGENDDVIIPDGTPPCTLSVEGNCYNLKVGSNGKLIMTVDGWLNVYGASIIDSGTVKAPLDDLADIMVQGKKAVIECIMAGDSVWHIDLKVYPMTPATGNRIVRLGADTHIEGFLSIGHPSFNASYKKASFYCSNAPDSFKLNVHGDIYIWNGFKFEEWDSELEQADTIWCGGSWANAGDFTRKVGYPVIFYGDEDTIGLGWTYEEVTEFADLTVVDTAHYVLGYNEMVKGNADINGYLGLNAQVLQVDTNVAVSGTLHVDAGSYLLLSDVSEVDVNDGGVLKAIGNSGTKANISGASISDFYTLNINSGGKISAKYAKFNYTCGITIADGATIGGLSSRDSLYYCEFGHTQDNDTLLCIMNDQKVNIWGAYFPHSATGANNVYSNNTLPGAGGEDSIIFWNYSGPFSGTDYELDPTGPDSVNGIIFWKFATGHYKGKILVFYDDDTYCGPNDPDVVRTKNHLDELGYAADTVNIANYSTYYYPNEGHKFQMPNKEWAEVVFMITADASAPLNNAGQRGALINYVLSGGRLFVSSGDLCYDTRGADGSFGTNDDWQATYFWLVHAPFEQQWISNDEADHFERWTGGTTPPLTLIPNDLPDIINCDAADDWHTDECYVNNIEPGVIEWWCADDNETSIYLRSYELFNTRQVYLATTDTHMIVTGGDELKKDFIENVISWLLEPVNLVPDKPVLVEIFDNAEPKMDVLAQAVFKFHGDDPEKDFIQYNFQTDDDYSFGSIDKSDWTSSYAPLGEAAFYMDTTGLTQGTTYWWRVAGKDPAGSQDTSLWSDYRSFTVASAERIAEVDTFFTRWYQTTNEQWLTNTCYQVKESAGSSVLGDSCIFYDNFDDETTGEEPSNWTTSYSGVANVSICDTVYYGSGGKCCHFVDTRAGEAIPPAAQCKIGKKWTPALEKGTIEWRCRTEKDGFAVRFHKVGGTWTWSTQINMCNNTKGISVEDANNSFTTIGPCTTYAPDKWYHMKMEFDCVKDSCWVYIDGDGPHGYAIANEASLDSATFLTYGSFAPQNAYLDEVSVSKYDASADSGKMTSGTVIRKWAARGWNALHWEQNIADDSIRINVQYLDAGVWKDSLPGTYGDSVIEGYTSAGCVEGTLKLGLLDSCGVDSIRLMATLYRGGGKASENPELKWWDVRYTSEPLAQKTPGLWIGVVSTDWDTRANWDDSLVPGININVRIPEGCPYYPDLDEVAYCNNFTMDSGGVLNSQASGELEVHHNFKAMKGCTLKLDAGGVIIKSSLEASVTIRTASGHYFHNLTINSLEAKVVLASNIDVNNNLTITAGTFNPGSHTVYLAGNFVNNSTFKPSASTIYFDSTLAQTISGDSSFTFYNLTCDKSGGTAEAQKSIAVKKQLKIDNGTFSINPGDSLIMYRASSIEVNGGVLKLVGTADDTVTVTLASGSKKTNVSKIWQTYEQRNIGIQDTHFGPLKLKLSEKKAVRRSGSKIATSFEVAKNLETLKNAQLLASPKSPGDTVFGPESFEGDWMPTDWTQYDCSGDASDNVWERQTDCCGYSSPEGTFCARMYYDASNVINRALETPNISLYEHINCQLSFYSCMFNNWKDTLIIELSTNTTGGSGDGDWTELARYLNDGSNDGWIQRNIDISAYDREQTVYIRFRSAQPADANANGVDYVIITGDYKPHPYTFNINSGGHINAKYYKFEKMDSTGLVINEGAFIETFTFESKHYGLCAGRFTGGTSGGTYLTINNYQGIHPDTLHIFGVIFDTLWAWNMKYNVAKTVEPGADSGYIMMDSLENPTKGSWGNFYGEAYEYDTYTRIFWGYSPNPLSVELASFEAIGQYESVLLQWITESESDHARWLLARSEKEPGIEESRYQGVKESSRQNKFRLQNANWKVKDESPARQTAGRQKLKTSDADILPQIRNKFKIQNREKDSPFNQSPFNQSDWQIIAEVQAEGGGYTYDWIDSLVEVETTYWYKLGDISNKGDTTWHDNWIDSATPKGCRIVKFGLKQSWPNPFADKAHIEYAVPGKLPSANKLNVSLKIYDITGRLVKTVIDKRKSPGSYEVGWDGKTDWGRNLPAGVYFYRLQVGRKVSTKKLILIR